MKKKLVGMIATATLLTMALAGNVQAAEIRSVIYSCNLSALWRKRLVNFSAEGTGRYFWRTWY